MSHSSVSYSHHVVHSSPRTSSSGSYKPVLFGHSPSVPQELCFHCSYFHNGWCRAALGKYKYVFEAHMNAHTSEQGNEEQQEAGVKSIQFGVKQSWVQILTLSLTSTVILGKLLLNLSFPFQYRANKIYLKPNSYQFILTNNNYVYI